jgi:hypothetical protein
MLMHIVNASEAQMAHNVSSYNRSGTDDRSLRIGVLEIPLEHAGVPWQKAPITGYPGRSA